MARLFISIIAIFFGVGVTATSAMAQDGGTATITIHAAECPAGYTGGDYFTDCHGQLIPGVTFDWLVSAPGATQTVTTGTDGTAVIETTGLDLGINFVEEAPFEVASFAVFCSINDGSADAPVTYGQSGLSVFLQPISYSPGDQVVCDWYNIPVGSAPSEPTETPESDGPTVTLPNTGSGHATADDAFVLGGLATALGFLVAAMALHRRSTI